MTSSELNAAPDEKVKYWLALNMVVGVGKTLFHRLVDRLGSPEGVFSANEAQLTGVEGIGRKIASEILDFEVEKQTERELRLAEKLGVRILTLDSGEYPPLLKSIYDPPPVLYCQGDKLNQFPVTLAVVGTRMPTSYGKYVTEQLCRELAGRGVCVVSGLARGIDTIAHKAALETGGKTVAVFGCGLANTYPPENRRLRNRITGCGTVVSEFPLTMGPERMNFPARNRVISGLSYGTLVVEAGEKSGAVITAQFALEQGREVFAVPGNIHSPKSRATNKLIQTGAKLVDGADAVVEDLPLSIKEKIKPRVSQSKGNEELTRLEQKILSFLNQEEQHIDRIIENTQLSPAEVSATLVQLELRGLVRQLDGKIFMVSGEGHQSSK